jgi:hypothetical protein
MLSQQKPMSIEPYFRVDPEEFFKATEGLFAAEIGGAVTFLSELSLRPGGKAAYQDVTDLLRNLGFENRDRIMAVLRAFEKIGWCIVEEIDTVLIIHSRHFEKPRD